MRKVSAEALEVIAAEVQERNSTHCLTRVLAAPVERVHSLLLDPRSRMTWRSGTVDDKMELEVCFNGELALKESHYGVMFNTRISLIEHGMCSSVIRVRLNPQPPHDPEVIYELGIDDLWEERLYAIADALLEYSGGQIERLTIPDPSEHPFHKH